MSMPRSPLPVAIGLLLILLCPYGAQAQEAAVQRAAEQVLADRYPESADRMKVRVRRVRGDVDSTAQLRLQFSGRNGTPDGLAQADVLTRRASGDWQEVGWALLRVARYDSVATVQRRLRAGDAVAPADVEPAWMNVSDVHGTPLRLSDVRAQATEGTLVATRHLRSGRTLREGDVRPPYAVDTGTSVKMHYRNGRVRFRLACKVREPGGIDEVVRVRCPDTSTMYRARVVTETTVRWVETL